MRRRLRRSVSAALVLLPAAACGGGEGEAGPPVEVTVPSGATFGTVVDSLVARDMVDFPTVFRVVARLRGDDRNVRSGLYSFRRDSGWFELLDALTEGRVETVAVTVPEGLTLREISDRIAPVTGLEADSVRMLLQADSLERVLDVPGPGLEGYLFPDTYRFAPGTSVQGVLEAMVDRYRRAWTEERKARLDSLELSEREAMTLASIVQAEARRVEEMPTISAVYHNRLRIGLPLQADPTVLYALGGTRERLLYAAIDSVADNPYNTYRHPGLPPGPIGAPGEAALDAALQPADVSYLYFVARPDGTHIFTRTLEEHNQARVRARRLREQARSDSGSGSGQGP